MLKYGNNFGAKPFLKWAGGKKQLISTIEDKFPLDIKENHKINKYYSILLQFLPVYNIYTLFCIHY